MAAETTKPPAAAAEEKFASCECCGLSEECTPAYIVRVRERYCGRWICGLCAEAVDDEIARAGGRISGEEALARHMRFSVDFRSRDVYQRQLESAERLIAAMRQILRRSVESPRSAAAAVAPASLGRRNEESGDGVVRSAIAMSDIPTLHTIAG